MGRMKVDRSPTWVSVVQLPAPGAHFLIEKTRCIDYNLNAKKEIYE